MTDKRKNILSVGLVAAVLFSLALWCWVKPADPVSLSERRALAAMPELSAETVWSGKFMEGFEKYAADQFPLRTVSVRSKCSVRTGCWGRRM